MVNFSVIDFGGVNIRVDFLAVDFLVNATFQLLIWAMLLRHALAGYTDIKTRL